MRGSRYLKVHGSIVGLRLERTYSCSLHTVVASDFHVAGFVSSGSNCGLLEGSETKKSVLVLVLQVWYCFVKNDLVTLVVIMISKDAVTFQVLFYSFSILCLEHTVEINSGVHLLKS